MGYNGHEKVIVDEMCILCILDEKYTNFANFIWGLRFNYYAHALYQAGID